MPDCQSSILIGPLTPHRYAAGPPSPARGEGKRLIRPDGRQDCMQNSVNVIQNFVVPETQDTEALRFQILASFGAVIRMAPAIDFDDQTLFKRDEIDDIGSDRNLTTKLDGSQFPSAQSAPQNVFRVSGTTPKRSCLASGHRKIVPCISSKEKLPSPLAGEGGPAAQRWGVMGPLENKESGNG